MEQEYGSDLNFALKVLGNAISRARLRQLVKLRAIPFWERCDKKYILFFRDELELWLDEAIKAGIVKSKNNG